MLSQQLSQFFLFPNPRSSLLLLLLLTPTIFAPPPPLPPPIPLAIRLIPSILNRNLLHPLPLNLPLLQLIPTMIHPQHPAQNRRPAQIVHRQIAAALVLVFQKSEPPALAGFFVAREVQVHGVAVLREEGQDVTFAELEGEAADVDVGCVAVVGVPGGVGRDAFLELEVV